MRDAVDFDHAAGRDPDSLTFAINTLSPTETEERKGKFLLATGKFGRINDPVIRRMNPEHRPNLATLGQAVATTIQGLRYAEVGITVQKGVCHFEARTHNKHSIHLQFHERRVNNGFASFGINEYLDATLKDPGEVRNRVRHACRRRRPGTLTVVHETHAAPKLPNTNDDRQDSPKDKGRSRIGPGNEVPPPDPGPHPEEGAAGKARTKSTRRTH